MKSLSLAEKTTPDHTIPRTAILFAVIACWLGLAARASEPAATREEMQQKRRWVNAHLLGASAPPFSFRYATKDSAGLLGAWPRTTHTRRLDRNRTEHTAAWKDPATGLSVRCVAVEYDDFPVVEWTVYLKNGGARRTPLLEDVQGLDAAFSATDTAPWLVHTLKGDCCSAENYQPLRFALGPGESARFAPAGGRPTNGPTGWPYYRVEQPCGQGLIVAIGWPGQWAAAFLRDRAGSLRITAGQQTTRLALEPGEEVRTPLIALMFRQDADAATNAVRAQNMWRRWLVAHNIPRRRGKLPEPFFTAVGNMGDIPDGERWYARRIDAVRRTGFDWNIAWVDAGWYPCHGQWEETGTWEIDRTRYPNGFRKLADTLHAQGRKLVVWFEPERVRDPKGWLATRHPQWLLGFGNPPGSNQPSAAYWPKGWDKLLNLGHPEALAWAIEHFDRMIKSEGIDVYRQDFNIEPLPYWQRNDPPDRQGITENFYVRGYLAYLDALLARNPDLWSDVSASGGRRNDLETLRRALPLRRSDYEATNGTSEAMQSQTLALSNWLVYFGTLGVPSNAYAARSTYLPALVIPSESDLAAADVRRVFQEYPRVAPRMLGDFYPLADYGLQTDRWTAWQFDRPEQSDGVVQVFRRGACAEATRTFRLRGLRPEARYEIVDFDRPGAATVVTGNALMDSGLSVTLDAKPAAAVFTYRRE